MKYLKAELTHREILTPNLGIFRFRPEKRIDYLAGQYVTFGIRRAGLQGKAIKVEDGRGTVLRPYSLASAPFEDELELYVAWVRKDGRREDQQGQLSTELFNPAPDAEYLLLEKARGSFLPTPDTRDLVMVATGTGLAPFISMLKVFRKEGSRRRFFLIHGVSRSSDLAYRGIIAELSRDLDIKYRFTLSREEAPGKSKDYAEELFMQRSSKGRVSVEEAQKAAAQDVSSRLPIEDELGHPLRGSESVLMLCGNPAMIENIKAIAAARGFQPKQDIISEEYW